MGRTQAGVTVELYSIVPILDGLDRNAQQPTIQKPINLCSIFKKATDNIPTTNIKKKTKTSSSLVQAALSLDKLAFSRFHYNDRAAIARARITTDYNCTRVMV